MYSRTHTHTHQGTHTSLCRRESDWVSFLSPIYFSRNSVGIFHTHFFITLTSFVLVAFAFYFKFSTSTHTIPSYTHTYTHVRKHTHTHTHTCTCASLKRRVNAIISFFPSQLSSICLYLANKKKIKMRKEEGGENKIKMKTRLNKHLSSLGELFAICYCACSICGSPYKHNLVFFFLFTFIAWDMSACLVAMPFYAHTHTHTHARTHAHTQICTHTHTHARISSFENSTITVLQVQIIWFVIASCFTINTLFNQRFY